MSKKVLINVNSIVKYTGTTHLSGIGRATYSLINGFARLNGLPFRIELYSQRLKSGGLTAYNLPFDQKRVPLPNTPTFSNLINRLRIKEVLTKYDLYHIPHNTDYVARPEKTIFTIHDLMIYKFPEYFPFSPKFENWAKKLVHECRAIVTCSKSSKNDISFYWNVEPEKISIIEWGVDRKVFFPAEVKSMEVLNKKLRIKAPYFLSISNSHPRKNIIFVLNAFQKYNKINKECQLIVLWGDPPRDLIREYINEISSGKIIFANHVNDEELRALYSGAIATLFPSLYEGFGFPVLESLACHTPIITCANSSLRELGADLVIYTSENDIDEFVNHLVEVQLERQKFINENKIERHLAKYDWNLTCDKYINLYTSLIL